MTIKDLKSGIKVQLKSGTTFLIEEVNETTVISSIVGGAKGNYKTEINDAVLFFNEEEAIIL